jgi:hypothetical protein
MSKFRDLSGLKFNRLTVIAWENGKWRCICECGNTLKVQSAHLTNGNTKSCGCLKTDNLSERSNKLIDGRKKFEPRIASARRVWKNTYCYRDNNCLDFDNFLKISQQNCYYCGGLPNTKYNHFLLSSSKGSIESKQNGLFIYNGMDRVDNNKFHTIDNVVSCCYDCNRAKSNRNIKEFKSWINNLQINTFEPTIILNVNFPSGSLATSIKCVFYNFKKDTDLTLEEYYSVSQMNCFYCNSPPNNSFNRAKTDKKSSKKAKVEGNYIYNGIDRINSALNHSKNNIVPCCYHCNRAKSDLSFEEFQVWIKRIKEYTFQCTP